MPELTADAAKTFITRLEQNFEDAGDWNVQPTLMLITVFAGQDPNTPGTLGVTPVFPSDWISDGQLVADALAAAGPPMLCPLVPEELQVVAVAVAYEAKVLEDPNFGKDARLLYCGLADGTLVGAGRVRGDEANVKTYAPDHPHDTTPAAVRRLAMAVLGGL
ncbi:hypothetical protein [Nonomuraea wenchangensis]|uniref:Uncharacterized protein n=1 Tax=Nonomuraea wenchangensis TaxID=568860 RepID=A0A1I0LTH7_9ACTN|nr:hypothetical protein [Nonomuraea wenchangensis]SEU46460.1 hypothetical protein SAMN05421811_12739 [Nonomuraea wenchangensis]